MNNIKQTIIIVLIAIVAGSLAGMLSSGDSSIMGEIPHPFTQWSDYGVTNATSGSTVILATSTGASYRMIKNASSSAVWCSLDSGADAVGGADYKLGGNSEYEIAGKEGNLYVGTISCAASGTASIIYLQK